MIRIREILDPDLRRRIVEVLADRRGCSSAAIPDWFELDDADFVDLLNDLKEAGEDSEMNPRMIRECGGVQPPAYEHITQSGYGPYPAARRIIFS